MKNALMSVALLVLSLATAVLMLVGMAVPAC